jgi:hypothetical protein
MKRFLCKDRAASKSSPLAGKWTAPAIVGVCVLILGLFTACPKESGSKPSGTEVPAASGVEVAKTQEPQDTVTFTLTSSHNGTWKVYGQESGGAVHADVSAVFYAPDKTLRLISEAGNVAAGDYWVTVTQSGRTESPRLKLTVTPFSSDTPEGQTPAPTASAVSITKTGAVQASIGFTLTSTHTGDWKVYGTAEGGTPLTAITARFDLPALILTHASDVPAASYWVTVTDTAGGKTESARLKLTVKAYTPEGQTEAPEADVVSVAKTAAVQASIGFTLTSTNTGDWKVYGQETGGDPLTAIIASFSAPTLTLTHTADVPADEYWVTVTDSAGGKTESARLKLTVEPYTAPGASTTPTAAHANASVAKTAAVQASIGFTLTSTNTGDWKVYGQETGGDPLAGITASFTAPTLTLTHATDVPEGNYWVTVTENGKDESARLKLTVTEAPPATISSITQAGGTSALTDSTSVKIVFSRALGTDLAASDITISSGATRGTLTKDNGTNYTLAISNITKEGDITLTFSHDDIADTTKTVRVFKSVTHTADHASAAVPGLYAGDMDVPVSGLGNTDTGASLLSKAFDWVKTNAKVNGKYRIVLGANANQAAKTLAAADFHSVGNVVITLAGDTAERTIQLTGTGSLFTINYADSTLRLDNFITLKGVAANTQALVRVQGGSLVMENGSKITGNTINSSTEGFTVGDNVGGGVNLNGTVTFTMNGGEISYNKSLYTPGYNGNGGGVFMRGASPTFTMNGGIIKNNEATYGGGVQIAAGTFTMTGGSIETNKANSWGGGVGVNNANGVFTMNGTAEISNGNNASNGGGVQVNNGTFNMAGSAVIKGNSTTGNGGGVNIIGTGRISKTGGTIYGSSEAEGLKNTAAEDKGAAVYDADGMHKRETTVTEDLAKTAQTTFTGDWDD